MNWNRKKIERLVGIFVVVPIVILIGFALVKLSASGWFEKRITLVASFDRAAGLRPGSVVALDGIEIGRVKSVGFDRDNRIRVEMGIRKQFVDQIREDSVATVERVTIFGLPILNISVGSPEAPRVKEGSRLETKTTRHLQPRELHILITNVADLIAKLSNPESTLGRIIGDNGEAYEELKGLLESGNRILKDAPPVAIAMTEGSRVEMSLVPELQKQVEDLSRISSKLEKILGSINAGEGTIGAMVKDRKLYDELTLLITEARTMTRELRSVLADLKQLTPELPELARDGHTLIEHATRLVNDLQANPLIGGGVESTDERRPMDIQQRIHDYTPPQRRSDRTKTDDKK